MMTIDITGALAHEHIADLRGTAARYNLAHETRRNGRREATRPVATRSWGLSRIVTALRGTSDCCPATCEAC